MTDTVRCPECDAALRLKPGIKKARCPRCKSIIDLTAPSSSGSPAAERRPSQKKRTPQKRQPEAPDPWEDEDPFEDDDSPFEDDFEDYEDYEKPRERAVKPKKKSKPRSKKKKKAPSGPMLSEETRQQVMSFGWLLVGLGALSFVLPFIGLQIKGLHALGPEGQMFGGMMLIGFGVFMLVISALGDVGVSIFGFVKWGLIGIAGFSLVSCIGCIGVVNLMQFFKKDNAPAFAVPHPAAVPHQMPMGRSAPNPVQDSNRPNFGPSFRPPNFQSRMDQQFAQYTDDEILNLELLGFSQAEHPIINKQIRDKLGVRLSMATLDSEVYKMRLAPVSGDVNSVAEQLDFVNVTSVDPQKRLIVLTKK